MTSGVGNGCWGCAVARGSTLDRACDTIGGMKFCGMKFRLGLLIGFGVGYYLGARAGRERYEQLRSMLARTPLSKVQAAYELGVERLRERTASHEAVVPPSPN